MRNYRAGFGSGGGVGDRPANHNEADVLIAGLVGAGLGFELRL